MFIKAIVDSFIALFVYVDDVILIGNDRSEITHMKQFLDSKFQIKDLGDLNFFLVLEVAHNKFGIHLCQRKYALEVVADAGLLSCKPVATPIDSALQLSKN